MKWMSVKNIIYGFNPLLAIHFLFRILPQLWNGEGYLISTAVNPDAKQVDNSLYSFETRIFISGDIINKVPPPELLKNRKRYKTLADIHLRKLRSTLDGLASVNRLTTLFCLFMPGLYSVCSYSINPSGFYRSLLISIAILVFMMIFRKIIVQLIFVGAVYYARKFLM